MPGKSGNLASVFRGRAASGGLSEQKIKERSGGGGDPKIVRFKDGEAVPLQFCGDPRDKRAFREFDQHSRKLGGGWEFVPCIGDECLACADEDEKFANPGYAFVAQVWDFKQKSMKVLTGGTNLAQAIVYKYKRNPQAFTKRVWDTTRLATTPKSYQVDVSETARPLNLSSKEPEDLAEYLASRYQMWAKKQSARPSTLDDDEDEYDDEAEEEMDDEEEVPTRKQMMKMEWADLKDYAKSVGVTLRTTKRSELIDAIEEELAE